MGLFETVKAGILPAPSAIRANISADERRERHTLGIILYSEERKSTITHTCSYEPGRIKAQ